jgi:hypothetical protein
VSIPRRQELFADWLRKRKPLLTSPPPYVVLGAKDLDTAAREARSEAAAGRQRPYRAERALSSLALLFMAFESWVNHQLTGLYLFAGDEPQARQNELLELLLRGSLSKKARHIPKYAGGAALHSHHHPDLDLLVAIRHELTHDLPATNVRGEVSRLDSIERMGLLRSSGHREFELMLHERLASYDLAYWAWGAVRGVADSIAVASERLVIPADYHNFDLPQQWSIPTPEGIAAQLADSG